MASFIEAVRVLDGSANNYTGTAANVLDADPTTYCDLFLNGDGLADFLRLDTGAAGQPVGQVTLRNVAVIDADHPVRVFVGDAAGPDAHGDIPQSVSLTLAGANPQPGTADYVFSGQGAAGRYVWVRMGLPPNTSYNSRMTIGGTVSWNAPAQPPPPAAPVLTATGQLVNGQPAIVLTVT